MTEELEDRIINKIGLYEPTVERVEVIDLSAKEMQPIDISWIGASVLCKLESIEVEGQGDRAKSCFFHFYLF
jgi:actin-related protein